MGFERIDLADQVGMRKVRAFGCGNPAGIGYQRIAMGTCDRGWWVRRTGPGRRGNTWLVPDERAACEFLDRQIRRGGTWFEVPACYDARGLPADGRTWVKVDGRWHLDKAPSCAAPC